MGRGPSQDVAARLIRRTAEVRLLGLLVEPTSVVLARMGMAAPSSVISAWHKWAVDGMGLVSSVILFLMLWHYSIVIFRRSEPSAPERTVQINRHSVATVFMNGADGTVFLLQ